ncbi:peptidoglycan-binding protein [Paracoccus sp. IB05]|uniref:peptidoglycan-binding domain-containing protein n=1 Tax=Paracoccus sp. IB05 TaxID=2779367 RepID=UPI0018E7D670|nr:peptidoglycan-binding protein [Paracoccus sp. IB05]MBJ2149783.1 peptidoglycan-binding protein [Paracoccus sp. IB05]
MRRTVSAIAMCLCLGGQSPVMAQGNLEDIVSGVAQSLLVQELDRQAAAEARRAGTLTGWRAYLTRFPNGAHRSEAEREIARLGGSVRPTEPAPAPAPADSASATEAALALSREQRRQIQSQLTSLGYDAGVADGLWGRKTREAIRGWQSANGATASGYVTERQVRQIREQAGGVAPPVDDTATDDRSEERLLGLTVSERRDIQRRLTALGYRTGGTDGVLGQNSRRAIAAWQRDEGLRASGYITADQLRELRRQTGP